MTGSASWRELAEAGHTGDAATARAALTADDAASRELAIGALHRMQQLTPDELAQAMSDTSATVRRRAALIAATRPGTHLLGVLADQDASVVEAAAWAAGEHATEPSSITDELLARLIALGTDADEALVREAAVAALGAIGDERGLPTILKACTDKPTVRRRAVLALAPFEGAEVEAAIAAALDDRDWQVRQAAEDIAPDRT